MCNLIGQLRSNNNEKEVMSSQQHKRMYTFVLYGSSKVLAKKLNKDKALFELMKGGITI